MSNKTVSQINPNDTEQMALDRLRDLDPLARISWSQISRQFFIKCEIKVIDGIKTIDVCGSYDTPSEAAVETWFALRDEAKKGDERFIMVEEGTFGSRKYFKWLNNTFMPYEPTLHSQAEPPVQKVF